MNQLPCKNCGCWEDDFSLYGGLCVDCLLKENQQLKEQLAAVQEKNGFAVGIAESN